VWVKIGKSSASPHVHRLDAGIVACGAWGGVSMPNTKMPAARLGINNIQVGKYVPFARISNPDVYQRPKVRLKVLCIHNMLWMQSTFVVF
jgi:hypothetical protein